MTAPTPSGRCSSRPSSCGTTGGCCASSRTPTGGRTRPRCSGTWSTPRSPGSHGRRGPSGGTCCVPLRASGCSRRWARPAAAARGDRAPSRGPPCRSRGHGRASPRGRRGDRPGDARSGRARAAPGDRPDGDDVDLLARGGRSHAPRGAARGPRDGGARRRRRGGRARPVARVRQQLRRLPRRAVGRGVAVYAGVLAGRRTCRVGPERWTLRGATLGAMSLTLGAFVAATSADAASFGCPGGPVSR